MSVDGDAQQTDQDSACASATMCGVADSDQCSAEQSPSSCFLKPSRSTARHIQRDDSPQKAAVKWSTDPPQLQRTSRLDNPQPYTLPRVRMGPPPPPPPPPPAWEAPTIGHARTEQQQAWQRHVPPPQPRFNPLPPAPDNVSALSASTAQQHLWPGLTAGSSGVFMPLGWGGAPKVEIMRLCTPGASCWARSWTKLLHWLPPFILREPAGYQIEKPAAGNNRLC